MSREEETYIKMETARTMKGVFSKMIRETRATTMAEMRLRMKLVTYQVAHQTLSFKPIIKYPSYTSRRRSTRYLDLGFSLL